MNPQRKTAEFFWFSCALLVLVAISALHSGARDIAVCNRAASQHDPALPAACRDSSALH
jgi:hypothetical protein